ncbi:MAG: tRNA-(ms[2]io[6]A)-hydroxylase [Candidatus Kapaibacterium sp.]|jgi:tRNA-(ms[2]io[6]A)-hydroxylase
MLGLQCATTEAWILAATLDPASLLIDHAHCEKKAAVMAISVLTRYPTKRKLVEEMANLAQEEMSHFAQVLDILYARGYTFGRDPGDTYVQALRIHIRKQEPGRLLDTLLVNSLIEARSCERFQLLANHVPDQELSEFYRSLLESEAGHRTMFLELAREYFPKKEVKTRLEELSAAEAAIITTLSCEPTMHG